MYTVPLRTVGLSDINIVGGKAASLGEMISNLRNRDILVPGGFVITAAAYSYYIEFNNIDCSQVNTDIKSKIINGKMPEDLQKFIIESYSVMNGDVAVRSSATAEDLPDASFAGQQDTFLHVTDKDELLTAVKNCFASLYNERAISYRESRGYNDIRIQLAVVVQEMVQSKVSGVAFSLDTESGCNNIVLINATYGLGELLVSGQIIPDEYLVFKQSAKCISKRLGTKNIRMLYNGDDTIIEDTPLELQNSYCLDRDNVEKLGKWVSIIEEYYSIQHQRICPVDVEWALNNNNELYIVQARPETIHSRKQNLISTHYRFSDDSDKTILCDGIAVGDKIANGKVCIIDDLSKSSQFISGSILVANNTNPDWEPLMKISSGIITNQGGRTCHASIVAREMGLPAIVGTKNATSLLEDDQDITLSCIEGETGYVYEGIIKYEETSVDVDDLRRKLTFLRVKPMINVGSPELAVKYWSLPQYGVGLAREEFIINNYIKVHPLALLNYDEVSSELQSKIDPYIRGYEIPSEYFIDRLASGMAKIAAAYHPNNVIIRFSDFKSNEYSNLIGGSIYEPSEENPMIGWRGAARYYSKEYKEAFGLECLAVRRAREEWGLTNIIIMIPFCRSVSELKAVYEVMASYGLERGKNGLRVYLMAEIPVNIILAHEFAKHIDGFSIGSNDLTQLTLGVDRDSRLVAHVYDERNEAVILSIKHLIKVAKHNDVKVGICGQAPSDFPDFAAMLVEEGIDTISVTPDALPRLINQIYDIQSS